MTFECPNCKHNAYYIVDTYKHLWVTCKNCDTVVRERKEKYEYNTPIFRFLIRNFIFGRPFRPNLLPLPDVRQDERHFYDYYNEVAKKGEKGTKWESANDEVIANLEKFGIDVKDKNILDISGGPGFLTKRLQPLGKRVVVTEFSADAVNGMTKALGIEGVKYDYNSDRLSSCLSDKFDVIIIVYSIGFCNDLQKFVRELKEIMHEKSVVYITYSPPSLGLMIRWQFDEYTYNRCWPIEVMTKCFNDIGMTEANRVDEGDYKYDHNWFTSGRNWVSASLYKVHRAIGRKYLAKALADPEVRNKELVQHNVLQVFRFR